ncbi:MAG: hypothetical protein GF398_03955 [Chitinivibrionales bacterium]|nr:hypothetical protein [Chitinivibrionales bacterium]
MKAALLIAVCATVMCASDYQELVQLVERDYTQKQESYNDMAKSNSYKWEFVEAAEIPLWCREDIGSELGKEVIWVDGLGQVLVQTDEGVYVAVKSWIDRKRDRAQVTRLYLYEFGDYGTWQKMRTFKITQNWNEEIGWVCQW